MRYLREYYLIYLFLMKIVHEAQDRIKRQRQLQTQKFERKQKKKERKQN